MSLEIYFIHSLDLKIKLKYFGKKIVILLGIYGGNNEYCHPVQVKLIEIAGCYINLEHT